ncbi:hypothetical protein L1987_46715 [Smallanthus sonchifolius]|uniref:Uncharacterized protein n=1 Tax=Smallanthus sonchifolius TaxID=185202 RepID=A0ACB9G077_9ASTR|nr:hypothetical protein L1987_46715 [Smallanthus sonchifolius]
MAGNRIGYMLNKAGASKKVRGYTQKAETWKMNSTQRIVITFNKFGKPVGDEDTSIMGLFPLQDSYTLVIEGLVITLALYCLLFIYKATKKTATAPEASGAWPIIGHFNLLSGSSDLPHLALASMADRCDPFSLSGLAYARFWLLVIGRLLRRSSPPMI